MLHYLNTDWWIYDHVFGFIVILSMWIQKLWLANTWWVNHGPWPWLKNLLPISYKISDSKSPGHQPEKSSKKNIWLTTITILIKQTQYYFYILVNVGHQPEKSSKKNIWLTTITILIKQTPYYFYILVNTRKNGIEALLYIHIIHISNIFPARLRIIAYMW